MFPPWQILDAQKCSAWLPLALPDSKAAPDSSQVKPAVAYSQFGNFRISRIISESIVTKSASNVLVVNQFTHPYLKHEFFPRVAGSLWNENAKPFLFSSKKYNRTNHIVHVHSGVWVNQLTADILHMLYIRHLDLKTYKSVSNQNFIKGIFQKGKRVVFDLRFCMDIQRKLNTIFMYLKRNGLLKTQYIYVQFVYTWTIIW